MTIKSYLARILWLNLINEYLSEQISMANKLKRIKFAHGEMKMDRNLEYAKKHFPSLLKKYEIDAIDIGFDLKEKESPALLTRDSKKEGILDEKNNSHS